MSHETSRSSRSVSNVFFSTRRLGFLGRSSAQHFPVKDGSVQTDPVRCTHYTRRDERCRLYLCYILSLAPSDSGGSFERDCRLSRRASTEAKRPSDGCKTKLPIATDPSPTTIAPYVRSVHGLPGRPNERKENEKASPRCTVDSCMRLPFKNFVSHRPRRGTATFAAGFSFFFSYRLFFFVLPYSCKRSSFRFVLCTVRGTRNERGQGNGSGRGWDCK